ncbi:hypothetical protein [Kitasatospora sp. NPDC088346]|uniref:hypothetical protein n=1 Tax=Kitasatospora sp. NPDC088346 TaxID=3364073 RepID=UPI00381A0FBD
MRRDRGAPAGPGRGRHPVRTGLGAQLVGAVEQAGRERGTTELVLRARVRSLGSYERLGHSAEGPEDLNVGVPPGWMTRAR